MFIFKSDKRKLSKNIESQDILINPASADQNDAMALHGDNEILVRMLFEQYALDKSNPANTLVFHKNQAYRIRYPDLKNPKIMRECDIRLTHDVVCREQQSLKSGKIKLRGSVISNNPKDMLGKGKFGSVTRLAGTLALENDGSVQLKTDKMRAIKIQEHNTNYAAKDSEEIARMEAFLLPYLPHSHGKSITCEYNASHKLTKTYLVMEEFQGIELFDLLSDDQSKTKVLPPLSRMKISINLLEALHKMHARGIVHRDIKPENILINPATLEVRIIDAGLGRMNGKVDGKSPGTPHYASPEAFSGLHPQTEASDTYSMALILFLVWLGGVRPDDQLFKIITERKESAAFPKLDNIASLNHNQKVYIRDALHGMTAYQPADRMYPHQAFKYFQHVYIEHQYMTDLSGLNSSEQNAVRTACNHAMDIRMDLMNSATKIPNDKIDDKLKSIAGIISAAVANPKLSDDKSALNKFVQVLGVKALQNSSSKAEVVERTNKIIHDFSVNRLTLKLIRERLDLIRSLLISVPSAKNGMVFEHINELDSYIDVILHRHSKTKRICDLDDLVELNARYQNELHIIEDGFTRIIDNECPELISSCADILQRLKIDGQIAPASALSVDKSKVNATINEYIGSIVSNLNRTTETDQQLFFRIEEAKMLVNLLEHVQDQSSLETGLAAELSKSKNSPLSNFSIFASPVYGSRLLRLLKEMDNGLKTVQTQLQSAAEIKPKSISILQYH